MKIPLPLNSGLGDLCFGIKEVELDELLWLDVHPWNYGYNWDIQWEIDAFEYLNAI